MPVAIAFGLSGVGKSWLCARLAETMGFCHVSASAVLKVAKEGAPGEATTSEALRKGAVVDNQALLLSGFRVLREREAQPILFDGHNIIDHGDRIIEIPFWVIQGLEPDGIVMVRADPFAIRERRLWDKTRDRPGRSADELRLQQDHAFQLAEDYSKRLDVKFFVVEAGDEYGFRRAITQIYAASGKAS